MAEINAVFDTVTKAFSVSMDGKKLTDVVGLNIYKRYHDPIEEQEAQEYFIELRAMKEDESNDVRTCTTIYANKAGDFVEKKQEPEKINKKIVEAIQGFMR